MAPKKLKLDEVVEVYVRVMGGEVAAASALAPKIGPLGISPKKVGEEIAKETAKEWKGIRVTVKIRVENRETKVSVVPSAAALLKKQIKDRANLSLGNVVEIAEVMRGRSLAKELAGTVMEMLGTCVSLGCTVDARYPKDLQLQISNGQLLLPVA